MQTHNIGAALSSKVNDFHTKRKFGYDMALGGYLLIWGGTQPTADDTPAKGGLWLDTTNGIPYKNTGTAAAPTWVEIGGAGDLPANVALLDGVGQAFTEEVDFAGNAKADEINESTADAGVIIDGAAIKDGTYRGKT